MKTYEPRPGGMIPELITDMVRLAREESVSYVGVFNGVEICTPPNGDAEALIAFWSQTTEDNARKWRESPEGQEAQRRADEHHRIAAAARAEGILPFTVSDQTLWSTQVANNTDSYGSGVIRYAARWANYMERKMATGATLESIAGDTGHEADLEGITGFMYGCAVQVLAACWKHGEQLRRWHNLKTQIGTEGEKANASGGEC